MASVGFQWLLMVINGSRWLTWLHVAHNGSVTPAGSVWLHIASIGFVWIHITPDGSMAPDGL